MYKCTECSESFNSPQEMANHVRWNHKNNEAYLENAKQAALRAADKRFGKLIKETVDCHKCGNSIDIEYREGKKKQKYFCSRSCANSRGKRSVETKNKISKSLSKDKIEKKCEYCENKFIPNRPHRKYCSRECSYSARRKKYDESFESYKRRCNFNFNLRDFPNEFDFRLIEKYGWYSASNRGNNLNGVSRDHMISVKYGYENKIDPSIISHPANCKLLRHNDNISKGKNISITLDDLIKRISEWDKKYKEGS